VSLSLALAAGLEGRVQVGIQGGGDALGQNPDHCVRLALEKDALPDQVSVTGEGVAPQAVAQNRRLRPVRTILRLGEIPSGGRVNREHVEVMRGDAPGMDILRTFTGAEIHAGEAPSRSAGEERRRVVAQHLPLFAVQNAAVIGRLSAGNAHVDGAQALRLRIGKVFDHERIDDGEDRRIRADSQRQRENHRRGKAGIAAQLPHGKSEILRENAH
jgi:hypothetical protein